MTAFAAILGRPGRRIDPSGVRLVSTALGDVHRTTAAAVCSEACALVTAPLHQRDPISPFVEPASGVVVVGDVLLEDLEALRQALDVHPKTSDVEIVGAAYAKWGTACSRRLSGEFGCALWDPRARRLLAVRDGLGLRRVYVAESPAVIVVTNILAAALSYPGISSDLDDHGVVSFLAHGAPHDGATVYRAVRVVPAGHTLSVEEDGQVTLARHWWFPTQGRSRRATMNPAEATEGYRHVLERAVRDRLREPRASLLLSGGIDSSTIAAAARATAPSVDLRACTAIYTRLPAHDELTYTRVTAERLQLPLDVVDGDACEALHAMSHGEPTPEPLDEPTLSDWRRLVAAAARHSTEGLYGEDGDSLFLSPGWRSLWRSAVPRQTAAAVARYVRSERRLPYLGIRLRERLRLVGRRVPRERVPFLSSDAREVLYDNESAKILGRTAEPLPEHPTRALTQQRLSAGVARFLAPLISAEVTRQRVALRCPLLDTRLLQFVVDLPAIPWCQQKRLPRLAYRDALDDRVTLRPKTGVAGLHEALTASWQKGQCGEAVRINESYAARWVDIPAWRAAITGRDPVAVGLAWRVLELDAWLTRRAVGSSDALPAAQLHPLVR